MRDADRRECEALGRSPKEALRMGLRTSLYALTAIEDTGEPTAMFGLNVASALTGTATPWLLGTDRIFMHSRELICTGSKLLKRWKSEYPCMENIVSADNDRAILLLKHWGAEIGRSEQMHGGVAFLTFRFPAIQAVALAA